MAAHGFEDHELDTSSPNIANKTEMMSQDHLFYLNPQCSFWDEEDKIAESLTKGF